MIKPLHMGKTRRRYLIAPRIGCGYVDTSVPGACSVPSHARYMWVGRHSRRDLRKVITMAEDKRQGEGDEEEGGSGRRRSKGRTAAVVIYPSLLVCPLTFTWSFLLVFNLWECMSPFFFISFKTPRQIPKQSPEAESQPSKIVEQIPESNTHLHFYLIQLGPIQFVPNDSKSIHPALSVYPSSCVHI